MNKNLFLSFVITLLIFNKAIFCMMETGNKKEHDIQFGILNYRDFDSNDSYLIRAAKDNNIAVAKSLIQISKMPILSNHDFWAYFNFINSTDNNGATALMFAVYNNNIEMVKLLLDNDADISIENKDGKTATYIARENGFIEILSLLRSQVINNNLIAVPIVHSLTQESSQINNETNKTNEEEEETNDRYYGTTDEEDNNNDEVLDRGIVSITQTQSQSDFSNSEEVSIGNAESFEKTKKRKSQGPIQPSNRVKHARTNISNSNINSTVAVIEEQKICACGLAFNNKKELEDHVEIQHKLSNRYLQCPKCNFKVQTLSKIFQHYLGHTNEKPYKCNRCGFLFNTKHKRDNHSKNCFILRPTVVTLSGNYKVIIK